MFHSSLWLTLCSSFFPLFKSVFSETLPPSQMGLAMASSGTLLELAGINSVGHGGNFWHLLTEVTAVTPPLPKPCHATRIYYNTPQLLIIQQSKIKGDFTLHNTYFRTTHVYCLIFGSSDAACYCET